LARRLHGQVTRGVRAALLLAGVVGAVTCSNPPAASPKSEPPPIAPVEGGGSSRGLSGRTPPASNGFPAIVILEPAAAGEMPPQADVPYMDQVQQTFTPAMLLVRTGQPTEFHNNDDVLHNVRVREDETKLPAFNVAIPTGEKYVFSFPRDGFYDVGCDIHPGMFAQIVSTSSPYATIADAEGNFSLDGVPPGAYKAVVYAAGKKLEKEIRIPLASATLDLTQ
jgi:plastocyanin